MRCAPPRSGARRPPSAATAATTTEGWKTPSMALNLGRWLKYAQAKLNDAVSSGNRELDQLEAEREAEIADRPWLASDGEAPTMDEARARIEWEAAEQQRRADATSGTPAPASPPAADATATPA